MDESAAARVTDQQQGSARFESPPRPEPAKTTIQTLATTLPAVAGSAVWILNAQIEKVVSGGAFVLKSFDEDLFHPATNDSRALMVTSGSVSRINPGTAMEVTGTVFTAAGARAQPDWPGTLTADDVKPYRDWPVVIADEIRTPGGVLLYERNRQ